MKSDFFKRTILENGVTIIVLESHLLEDDFVLKINKYGASIDKYTDIYGGQHLLEHAIFNQYRNLNVESNALTNENIMALTLNFTKNLPPKKEDPVFLLLKNWLFKNNNLKKIDLSRNLSVTDVDNYINELEGEYHYRTQLYAPWNLQTFLSTGGRVHYYGGNVSCLINKKKEIRQYISNPIPIPPDDLVIYIKDTKLRHLPTIKSLFSHILPIEKRPNLNLKFEEQEFYNKSIQINAGDTNGLVFLLPKSSYNNILLLQYIKLLYPFFDFNITMLDKYFLMFRFVCLKELHNFYHIIKHAQYEHLNLTKYYFPMQFCVDYLNIDLYDDEILDYILNDEGISYHDVYLKKEKEILNFFKMLTNKINQKEFILNLTQDHMNNRMTDFDEPYLLTEVSFNNDYFSNGFIYTFDMSNIYKFFFQKNSKLQKQLLQRKSCNDGIIEYNYYNSFSLDDRFNHTQTNDEFFAEYTNNFIKRISNCKNLFCLKSSPFIAIKNRKGLEILTNSKTYNVFLSGNQHLNYSGNIYMKTPNKVSIELYVHALMYYFVSPKWGDLLGCLTNLLSNKTSLAELIPDMDLTLSNKTHTITTEYNFVFMVVKVKPKKIPDIQAFEINLQEQAKRKGLVYFIELSTFKYTKFILMTFYTTTQPEHFEPFINLIKTSLISYNIKNINFAGVKSIKNANDINNDFSALDKKIKVTMN